MLIPLILPKLNEWNEINGRTESSLTAVTVSTGVKLISSGGKMTFYMGDTAAGCRNGGIQIYRHGGCISRRFMI
jgi:hypothetical protein